MSFIVVIPARFASQRLPGKPLIDIAGKTMIRRVYECAQLSDAERVIVATDDQRIHQEVERFGGEVIMTSENHSSGTDRLEEVVSSLNLDDDAVVVNVQGDEPMIPASVINQVAENLMQNNKASAATLCEPIEDLETIFNPNAVKVVSDNAGYALYFSRATIPWVRDNFDSQNPSLPEQESVRRHIGIYAYRVKLLHEFVSWPMSTLEKLEKLEQLRILSNGQKIHVALANAAVPGGVDTSEDWERVKTFFANAE